MQRLRAAVHPAISALTSMEPNPIKRTGMKVDETTVRRIARLARIKVTDEEAKSLEGEITNILEWVEQLGEVDTTSVEPMTRVVPIELKQRHDEVTDGDKADDVVANAPYAEDHYFVVPKVVE
jgi:aspartyl-tRNA(Asn)/glutamyl-tRNA(Gln) amidotransferase subunit C